MAEAQDTGCAKEQTIRGLLSDCHRGQVEIQMQLKKSFARQPEKEGKCEGVPPFPNVLDEIMAELKELGLVQKQTIEFIVKNINPKL